ncbi:unnamed protein product [Plasmodium vivax]|uniref:(malaria parasite P. vivax) hypothetical protein n=1 Tax=Plasmodium vivax TaxID=5855 RepID=A0A8S4HAB9_PLAVI|nr:unnamed protein product [Plasmodium vivax]
MGFSQLKQKYPFLGEMLKFYNNLEEPVANNDEYQDFLNICDKENVFITNLKGNEKNICKKILRNFILCNNPDVGVFFNCCGNLYVWLYYEIKKFGISNDNIKKIFDLPNSTEYSGIKYNPCPYITFNDGVQNPEDLMKLSIFNDNASTFNFMLKESKESNYCYLIKYVNECIDIYREMNRIYTFPKYCNNDPRKHACQLTNEFDGYYTSHILSKEGISHNFPVLSSDTPLKYIDGCSSERIVSNTVPEEKKQDTPTTGGASTALSAMVGIPPFLALIYKFTPVGKYFRFCNKNNTIITSNFDKNMENEIFHAIKEDSYIKEIQPKYNIGYEPT